MSSFIRRIGALAISMVLLAWQPTFGQQAPVRPKVGDTVYSVSAFPLYQFDTGLDGGGDYSVQRFFFRFDAARQMTGDLNAGIGVSYDHEEWDFTGATGFRGIPWEDIHRTGVNLRLQYTGIPDWTLFFFPSVQSSRESGAEWADSLQAGAAGAAGYRVSPRLTLGLGAGLFAGLEETKGYPFLLVRWQITDRLLLANPFRPGPTGPAGMELTYFVDDDWEVALGSAWRSFRFRLDNTGPAPEGIGQADAVPTWTRISWRMDRNWVFDLYTGYIFDGELKLEDRNGNEIGSVDQDPAPFGALTVTYRF